MNSPSHPLPGRGARRFLPVGLLLSLAFWPVRSTTISLAAPPPAETRSSQQDSTRLQAYVQAFTAPETEGRGPGSQALDRLASTIEEEFRSAGLQPGGDGSGYLQVFTPPAGDYPVPPAHGKKWGSIKLKNVIGILPGQAGKQAKVVVFGAHYDHLGMNPKKQPFPGADDNASGMAALLALARTLAHEGPFRNTLVFIAFSGEEPGLLGSRYYVEHPTVPLMRTLAMLNLDTVGRMDGRKLYIFGSASAAEFPEMLKGINLGQGLELVTPGGAMFASDQTSFFEKGIPVLHFFTGPNADYHKPTDTEDKINYRGILSLLGFLDEAAAFLANREDPLQFTPPAAGPPSTQTTGSTRPRRVSLGTMPDFSRESGGVLLQGTMPGSPAEKAGLQRGDILVRLGQVSIDNLADLSAALKGHQPGDTVEVEVLRGGQKLLHRVQLTERK